MPQLRRAMYRVYCKLLKIIVPTLRSSQYHYYETLREYTSRHPDWLDLGCGHQVFPEWMKGEEQEIASSVRLAVGIDYDVPSLRDHQAISNRLAGDIARLPFPDGTFDLVSANMVVEHLADPTAGLREICRVLKPGGFFVFHTPNYHNFWVFLASLMPDFVKAIAIRVLEERSENDVFPTHYRLNTARAIRKHAIRSGFAVRDLRLVSTSAMTWALGPLSAFELLVLRLLERPAFSGLRADIVAVLEAPEEPCAAGAVQTPQTVAIRR